METKKLIINTVVEKKIQQLSAEGLISANALYLVDDDDSNRTVLPSYDLMIGKINELNKSINKIDTSIKSVNNEILGLRDKQVVELPSDILDSIKNLEDLTRETSATISGYSDTSFITIRDKNNVNKYYTISTDTETNTKIWVETQYDDALFIKQSEINTDSQLNAIDEKNVEENISPLRASYAKLSGYSSAMLDLSSTLNRYEISTDTKIPSSKLVYHTISALDAATNEQIKNLAKDVTDEINVISTNLCSEITNQVETLSNDLSVELSVEINARQKAIKDLADRLSSAWKFQGVANELPTNVSQYANGDIIVVQIKDNDGKIVNTKEYGFDGEKFVELGSDYEYMASKNDLHTLSDSISTDLSVEIYNRDEAIKDLSTSLSSDLATLSDDLSGDLSNEIAIRKGIDTYLSNQINELSDHISADVANLSANLSIEIIAEINNRKANDKFLSGQIVVLSDGISADVEALSTSLSNTVDAEILALSTALSTEISSETFARKANDKFLSGQIDALSDGISADVDALSTALSTEISAEAIACDKAVEDLSTSLSNTVDAKILDLSTDLSIDLSSEIEARKADDDFLSGQIDALSDGISADIKALSTMLSTEISAEAIARDKAVEDLSTSLSITVDAKILALSDALSADVLDLSSNLSNEIDYLSNDIYKDLSIAMTTTAGTDDALSSFTFTQNGQTIGKINIPKDKVIESAKVVFGALVDGTFMPEDEGSETKSEAAKFYLEVVVANQTNKLYIPVPELADTYVGHIGTTIEVTIKSDADGARCINAEVKAGSIGTNELGDSAITTAKLADDAKNYIDEQIDNALTTTIKSLNAELTSNSVDSVISSIKQENGVLKSVETAKIKIAKTQVTDLTSDLTNINDKFTQFANREFDLRNSDGMANAISSLLVAFGANELSIIA